MAITSGNAEKARGCWVQFAIDYRKVNAVSERKRPETTEDGSAWST